MQPKIRGCPARQAGAPLTRHSPLPQSNSQHPGLVQTGKSAEILPLDFDFPNLPPENSCRDASVSTFTARPSRSNNAVRTGTLNDFRPIAPLRQACPAVDRLFHKFFRNLHASRR